MARRPGPPAGWSIDNCDLIIAGIPIDGFGEGGAIKITPHGDLAEYTEGQDGEGVYSFNPSRAHDITITLRRTSMSQNAMMLFHAISEALTGTPILPIMIIDRNTGSSYSALYCAIIGLPEVDISQKVSDAEWKLVASNMVRLDAAIRTPFVIG